MNGPGQTGSSRAAPSFRAFPSLGYSVREAQNAQKSTRAPQIRCAEVGHGPGIYARRASFSRKSTGRKRKSRGRAHGSPLEHTPRTGGGILQGSRAKPSKCPAARSGKVGRGTTCAAPRNSPLPRETAGSGSRSRPPRPSSRPGSARGRGFRRPSAGPFFGGSPALDRRSAGPRRGLPERPRERAQLAHYAARRPRPLPPSPLRPKGPPRALPRGLTLVVHNRDAPDHTRRKPGISRRSHRFAADFAPTLRREIADRGADRTVRSEHDRAAARTWSTGRDEKRGGAQRMPAPTFPERAAGHLLGLSARACRISTRARRATKNGGAHNACPRRHFPNVQPDKCRLSNPTPILCASSDNQSLFAAEIVRGGT